MMAMATAMMVRIALVAIGGHLIAIAIGMTNLGGAIGIDTDDRLHCMRDRPHPQGQEHGQASKKDRQSMHLRSF
jgi:hypothetical protein